MAITPTQRQVGPLSMSMTAASVNGTDTISNAELLTIAGKSRGALYKLLSATYADTAAFLTAFAQAGGILTRATDRPATNTIAWEVNAGAVRLSIVDTGVGNMAIRVALSYSAAR